MKPETLIAIDQFCIKMAVTTPAASKSFFYLRHVVSSILGTVRPSSAPKSTNTQTTAAAPATPATPASNLSATTATSSPSPSYESHAGRRRQKKVSTKREGLPGVGALSAHDSGTIIISDMLLHRVGELEPGGFPDLGLTLFANCQFGITTTKSKRRLESSNILACNESASADPFAMVCKSMKTEEATQIANRSIRRRRAQLFNYKCYNEQTELDLSGQQVQIVVAAIMEPPIDEPTRELRLMATKILIKLLADIYCRRPSGTEAHTVLLNLLYQMLEASHLDTKIHAFNLLFNLSVHMHMVTHVSILLEDNNPRSSQIDEIQEDLFKLLTEMLNWMVDRETSFDPKVWEMALNCTIFFITHVGHIIKSKLMMLSPRVVAAFLRYCDRMSNDTHRKVIHMLINRIYTPQALLNRKLLQECFNGIEFIISQYINTPSIEDRNNLFLILFDYAAHAADLSSTDPDVKLLLETLVKMNAPFYFPQLFKYASASFVSSVLSSLPADCNTTLRQNCEAILSQFCKMSTDFYKIDQQYEANVSNMISRELQEHIHQLVELLKSSKEKSRRNGEAWLFRLMCAAQETTETKKSAANSSNSSPTTPPAVTPTVSSLPTIVESVTQQLLSLHNSEVIHSYLIVTQRLLVYMKSKFQTFGDTGRLSSLLQLLNKNLASVCSTNDQTEKNLLLMFDIVFETITIRTDIAEGGSAPPFPTSGLNMIPIGDSIYTRFLRGRIAASLALLDEINITPLEQVARHLRHQNYVEVRAIAVKLLAERCKRLNGKKLLESLGGTVFFINFVSDTNPIVAYYASQFLVDHIGHEQPEDYRVFMTRMLAKARLTNDENLVSNPYYQMKAIMSGQNG
ncbi:Armadillo-type fold [Pelomyxa schiedti]|nr:Armadillo-type fold [Pelomyxa schiedti]